MFRGKTCRTLFSTLFLGVYLFVALFSQNYHHHGIVIIKESESAKFTENLANSGFDTDQSNCLSCHFLFNGSTLIPQEFSFQFHKFENHAQEIFADTPLRVVSQSHFVFLRGPPLNII